jgi:hypothetical protein
MNRAVALIHETPQLVQYERMRAAVERCANIDEAAMIQDEAAALLAYARQRDDIELMAWVSEIHLRAEQKCGEYSAKLEKARGPGRGKRSPDASTSFKRNALAAAGLSKQDASDAERLAGINSETRPRPKDTPAVLKERERLFKVGKQASEAYYADAKDKGRVPSKAGLQLAVDTAIAVAAGKPPPRPPALHPDRPLPKALLETFSPEATISSQALHAVRVFNEKFPDPSELAPKMHPNMRKPLIGALKVAAATIQTMLEALDETATDT